MKAFVIPPACHTAAPFKRHLKGFLHLALILTGALLTTRASAQTFTTLHTFGATAIDGAGPRADLVLSGSTLYGTTLAGGSLNYGALFALGVDGTVLRICIASPVIQTTEAVRIPTWFC